MINEKGMIVYKEVAKKNKKGFDILRWLG